MSNILIAPSSSHLGEFICRSIHDQMGKDAHLIGIIPKDATPSPTMTQLDVECHALDMADQDAIRTSLIRMTPQVLGRSECHPDR
jgi:hypothetical protein